MDKQEAIKKLQEIKDNLGHDPEVAHLKADQVLLDYLSENGADELAGAFDAIPKWWA